VYQKLNRYIVPISLDFDVKIKQIKEACSKKTASNLINGAKEKAQEVTYGGS
jgi:hypothetical protein